MGGVMKNSMRKVIFILAAAFACAIDVRADSVVATVTTGTNPSAIAIDSVTNMIYVANQDSNNVTVIN